MVQLVSGQLRTRKQTVCLADTTHVIKNGILYQRQEMVEALTQTVMELGHSIPWAGHLAFQKSLHQISNRFVWPCMYTQLKEFCACCEICQLMSPQYVPRAHLQPLPLTDVPFHRIGMDVAKPLESSSSGHRYILGICEHATRYPEAFALRSVKARQVANCLIQLFSRVGVPREILTDCGANFVSQLLHQVYGLLGVKAFYCRDFSPQKCLILHVVQKAVS